MKIPLARRAAAEFLATAFLLAGVVGSGIMAERLAGGNIALALLANSLATGAALVALIFAFGPISGAHMNPAVTMADAIEGGISWGEASVYIMGQFIGGIGGTICAHLMFGLPIAFFSHNGSLSPHARSGPAQIFSEIVATFGLISIIRGCSRNRLSAVPYAVGAYITAAYWFTASTSFANPAVTLARAFTDSFTGIRLQDVPAFIVAQLVGALAATMVFRRLAPNADAVPAPSEPIERLRPRLNA